MVQCGAVFLRRASRRLLASSLDDQSCEDSVPACCGTSAAAAAAVVGARAAVLVVAKRGSGFSFAGDGGGSDDGDDAPAPVESWFRGAVVGSAETSWGRLLPLLLPLLIVLPPSLSFLFPIILMAGFLTSKKSSALNPIIARQIISRILNRPSFA